MATVSLLDQRDPRSLDPAQLRAHLRNTASSSTVLAIEALLHLRLEALREQYETNTASEFNRARIHEVKSLMTALKTGEIDNA